VVVVESFGLFLRGLRWRAGPTFVVLAVSVVAMAGAALGPLYAHSAQESLLRDGLAQAPPVTTGMLTRGAILRQAGFTVQQLLDTVLERAADPELDPWYSPGTASLTVEGGLPTVDGRSLGEAQVGWHRGQCTGVVIVSGSCPDAAREAMVSERTAAAAGFRIGDVLRLNIGTDPDADQVTLVGTYDATTADPAAWGVGNPDQFRAAPIEGARDTFDEVVVDEATMLASTGDVVAESFRALDPASVALDDVTALRAVVDAAVGTAGAAGAEAPVTVSASRLPDHLDSAQPRLDAVALSSFAVTAQLVLLAWFVLFLIISAMMEERSGEIVVAKLRGLGPRSTVAFGLAEPVLILVVALPIGLVVALLADAFLVQRYLVAGTSVTLTTGVWVALLLCLMGGAAAAALAARAILTAPVLEQLRRTGGRSGRILRSWAVDVAVLVLAATSAYQLASGQSDSLALLAPGLITLAAGLLAVRILPRLARVEVARTRAGPRTASFLAARNLARRPSGLRIVVLLSIAVGLAVLAVDATVVASANRTDLARAQVGADQVLRVGAPSPGALIAAVEEVDPTGTWAMAAVRMADPSGGLLAVDARRLAAVTTWDPAWVGSSGDAIGPLLHPQAPAEPLPVAGALSLRATYAGDSAGEVRLSVAVRAASGQPGQAALGTLQPGTADYSADLPLCVDQPCRLVAFTLTQPVGLPAAVLRGTVTLSDGRDAGGPVDLAAPGPDGWRSGARAVMFPIEGGAEVTEASDGALTVSFELDPMADAGIEIADHPADLPVVQGGPDDPDPAAGPETRVVTGLDGRFTAISPSGSGVLPQLLRTGTLADLQYAIDATGATPAGLTHQVWLSASAPPDAQDKLRAAGLEVLGVDSLDQRVAELDRGGVALSLRLFVLASFVALLLGAGTLLATSYVVSRRRAYELAALGALGAGHPLLVRASRRENAVLAATGILVGTVSGLAAAWLAMPALLGPSVSEGPPPWYGPAWLAVLGLVAVVLLVLAVVADLGARRTVRHAGPELLRQVQE
jgi:predicted lysophospholipase L1 biosynthesis ABC-type transport system permease subunit